MNNKQNNVNRNLLDTQRTGADTAYNGFLPGIGADVSTARQNANSLRPDLIAKYSNNNNFLPAGMTPNAKGWFDIPGGGGGDYSQAAGGYSKFAETGGVNREDFNPALDSYKDFMKSGGVDPTALRQRATAIIPSFYDAYKRNAATRASVQGGFAPGFDAQMAEIGRQQGREGFNASRQVEGDIADKIQQGRMFGTSGYGGLMTNITGMEQQGKLAGLGGLTNIAQAGDANAARQQQLQLAMAKMYQEGGLSSAAGLSNIYGQDLASKNTGISQYLAGLGGMTGNQLGNLGIRSSIKDRGFDWGKALGVLGGIAGGGGNFGGNAAGGDGASTKAGKDPTLLPDPKAGFPDGQIPGTRVPNPTIPNSMVASYDDPYNIYRRY